MPPAKLIAGAARMGLSAMEGIDWRYYPAIRKAGMQISLVNSHGFVRGMLNPDDREYCLQSLRRLIDHAVEFGAPGVITFTGMRHKGISDAQACKNCVEGWKQIIGYSLPRTRTERITRRADGPAGREDAALSSTWGTPVLAGGNIYFLLCSGEAFVYATGPEFKLLAQSRFAPDGGDFSATPAVGDGELFIRSSKCLYCVAHGQRS